MSARTSRGHVLPSRVHLDALMLSGSHREMFRSGKPACESRTGRRRCCLHQGILLPILGANGNPCIDAPAWTNRGFPGNIFPCA